MTKRAELLKAAEAPHVAAFVCTWESLHVKPGERWSDNPTVTVLTFERAA